MTGISLREALAFVLVLGGCLLAFFGETLLGGKVLGPADVLRASAAFRDETGTANDFEPANRLLMDPVLQFQPWLAFNRAMLRSGRLPLWNDRAGCGAPHLANGQSAVFDPFNLLSCLGPMPWGHAGMAAGRLLAAGLGAFLLAGAWGLGRWGRWFAGLVYPFSGFLVVWLLYPVTWVAIWTPWLFLAVERAARTPGCRSAAALALATALVLLGGHVQTSAHVLLAGGAYALWRLAWGRGENETEGATAASMPNGPRRAWAAYLAGTVLGTALAAAQIVPLAVYLARSPVWADRERERAACWRVVRPRWLDAVCTAVPYAFGSQRRGDPNLAPALGVNNLNESAGGFVGLATLLWLAPLGLVVGRTSARSRVVFLAGLGVVGLLGAFRFPPIDNLLRALPVLGVADNRRLTLWTSFALTMLGGVGLDHLHATSRLSRRWIGLWVLGALVLAAGALAVGRLEPTLRARALAHYDRAARNTPGADAAVYRARGERQVRRSLRFFPRVYGQAALELTALALLAYRARRAPSAARWLRPALLAFALAELGLFGFGLNPAISRAEHEFEPRLVKRLRAGLPPGGRALGVGTELPPNVLMRFGLADPRNYDSVELGRSLDWFAPIYGPSREALTSRRDVTWASALRGRDRLAEACVGAIVGATPPPPGAFKRVEKLGGVWIAWPEARPWAEALRPQTRLQWRSSPGHARIEVRAGAAGPVVVRETWQPGWTARLDGRPAPVHAGPGPFLSVDAPKGDHVLSLVYDPLEARAGLAVSAAAVLVWVLALTAPAIFEFLE